MALTSDDYKRTIHELWKERDALRAEVDRLKGVVESMTAYEATITEQLVQARAEVERLKKINSALFNEVILLRNAKSRLKDFEVNRENDIAAAVASAKTKIWKAYGLEQLRHPADGIVWNAFKAAERAAFEGWLPEMTLNLDNEKTE